MQILAFITAGIASFYSLPGSIMANGYPFNPTSHVCAMLYEPLGERVQIVNDKNGRESWCIVSDRGPFVPGRVIDVSPAVMSELGFDGLTSVRIYRVVGSVPLCHTIQPLTCKSIPPKTCVLDIPKPALLRC